LAVLVLAAIWNMGETFVGALAYADDIVLIAPTPSAMNKMLTICEEFAIEYNVLFNASKSKCIYFYTKSRPNFLLHKYDVTGLNFTINDNNIEFVDNYKHLGHVISSEQTDDTDISEKRAVFIGQANNVLCYFAKLSAKVKYKLFISYCTSFFGRSCGGLTMLVLKVYARLGVEQLDVFNPCRIEHTVVCYHCYVTVCLFKINYVIGI
jgi:hypothetical protein